MRDSDLYLRFVLGDVPLEQLHQSPARANELAPALRLIFRNSPAEERDARVANALEMIRQGSLDAAGVLVARGLSGLRGAMVCSSIPGAAGLVWPPQVLGGKDQAA